jgi:hypothetical protein
VAAAAAMHYDPLTLAVTLVGRRLRAPVSGPAVKLVDLTSQVRSARSLGLLIMGCGGTRWCEQPRSVYPPLTSHTLLPVHLRTLAARPWLLVDLGGETRFQEDRLGPCPIRSCLGKARDNLTGEPGIGWTPRPSSWHPSRPARLCTSNP